MRVNTGLWRSQPKILYSLCFGGIFIIHTKFEINYARTTLDLDFIVHGHHFKIKINFRFRIAASLVHRGDLQSSSAFWSFFPDFYRSKNQENSKTSVYRTKNVSFAEQNSSHFGLASKCRDKVWWARGRKPRGGKRCTLCAVSLTVFRRASMYCLVLSISCVSRKHTTPSKIQVGMPRGRGGFKTAQQDRRTWWSCWGGAGGGGEDDTHIASTYHVTIDSSGS